MFTSKNRGRRLAVVLAAVVSLSAVGVVAFDEDDEGGEQEISLKESPKAIQQALEGVDVDEITVETEDGKKIYEVVIEIDDDEEIELELTAQAQLVGVEIEHEDEGKQDKEDD